MQSDLFSNPYPENPGYAKNSNTSFQAAEKLTGKDILYDVIIDYLRAHPEGATVDDLKIVCEDKMDRDYDRSTIAARFTELTLKNKIIATD